VIRGCYTVFDASRSSLCTALNTTGSSVRAVLDPMRACRHALSTPLAAAFAPRSIAFSTFTTTGDGALAAD